MADNFIEKAMLSLSSAYADQQGSLPVVCKQISDAFEVHRTHITWLESELARSNAVTKEQGELLAQLRDEVDGLRTASVGQAAKLDGMLDPRTGVATMTAVRDFCEPFERRETIEIVASNVERLQAQVESFADKSVLSQVEQTLHRVDSNVTAMQQEMLATTTSLRTSLSSVESRQAASTAALAKEVDDLSQTSGAGQQVLKERLGRAEEKATKEVRLAKAEVNESQEAAVAEIVAHLKAQAVVIDGLKEAQKKEDRRAPTQREVAEMRGRLDEMRGEMDKAEFRIHEAYSQCLAIAGAQQAPAASQLLDGQRQRHDATQIDASLISQASTAARGGGEGGDLSGVSSLFRGGIVPASSGSGSGAGAGGEGVPSSVELQVEALRREVRNVANVSLPACVGQVLTLKEQVTSFLAANERATGLLSFLCTVLAGPASYDELLGALASSDENRVVLVARRAVNRALDWHKVQDIASSPIQLAAPPPPPNLAATTIVNDATKETESRQKTKGPQHLQSKHADSAADAPKTAAGMKTPSKTEGGQRKASGKEAEAAPSTTTLGIDIADGMSASSLQQLAMGGANAIAADGVHVMHVISGGVGDQHGLQVGDVILSVNGAETPSVASFVSAMKRFQAEVRLAAMDSTVGSSTRNKRRSTRSRTRYPLPFGEEGEVVWDDDNVDVGDNDDREQQALLVKRMVLVLAVQQRRLTAGGVHPIPSTLRIPFT